MLSLHTVRALLNNALTPTPLTSPILPNLMSYLPSSRRGRAAMSAMMGGWRDCVPDLAIGHELFVAVGGDRVTFRWVIRVRVHGWRSRGAGAWSGALGWGGWGGLGLCCVWCEGPRPDLGACFGRHCSVTVVKVETRY